MEKKSKIKQLKSELKKASAKEQTNVTSIKLEGESKKINNISSYQTSIFPTGAPSTWTQEPSLSQPTQNIFRNPIFDQYQDYRPELFQKPGLEGKWHKQPHRILDSSLSQISLESSIEANPIGKKHILKNQVRVYKSKKEKFFKDLNHYQISIKYLI